MTFVFKIKFISNLEAKTLLFEVFNEVKIEITIIQGPKSGVSIQKTFILTQQSPRSSQNQCEHIKQP